MGFSKQVRQLPGLGFEVIDYGLVLGFVRKGITQLHYLALNGIQLFKPGA